MGGLEVSYLTVLPTLFLLHSPSSFPALTPPLTQAHQQTSWVIETEAKLKLEVQTIEGLKTLHRQGSNLSQNRGTHGHIQLLLVV